uniref:hypothetical protein n=1 Tax=Hydrocytium acuminatum TaxID=1745963 RepID=UPI002A803493|nr:hypothetical protein UYM18_pgp038 [Hydrocytium acuminatum]WOR09579.1 hypothetical protein [Hydrocytium acuminatum]
MALILQVSFPALLIPKLDGDLSASPDSGPTESALTESALTESALTESALTESALTESALTESALTESALTESALTESALTESALTESALTDKSFFSGIPWKNVLVNLALTGLVIGGAIGTYFGVKGLQKWGLNSLQNNLIVELRERDTRIGEKTMVVKSSFNEFNEKQTTIDTMFAPYLQQTLSLQPLTYEDQVPAELRNVVTPKVLATLREGAGFVNTEAIETLNQNAKSALIIYSNR